MHPEIVEMEKDAFVVRLDDIRDRLQRSHIISLSTMIDILDGQQPEAVPIYRMRAYIYEALTVAEAGLNGATRRPLQSFRAMQLHESSRCQKKHIHGIIRGKGSYQSQNTYHFIASNWILQVHRKLKAMRLKRMGRQVCGQTKATNSYRIWKHGSHALQEILRCRAVFLHGIAKRAKIHFSTRSFHCSVPAASCHQGMEENGYEAAPVQIALIRIYELLRLFQWLIIDRIVRGDFSFYAASGRALSYFLYASWKLSETLEEWFSCEILHRIIIQQS
ncbi:unnamed protein product [Cylicocyclus nassatus]|uniref:Uncharacterized protein n=1 Tax=Cylicocyclus nassatus TaxID=53992 RepID=A0AA36GY75_CYLNA|nr:unnamed protein product [Cylicocyclus nassatus]